MPPGNALNAVKNTASSIVGGGGGGIKDFFGIKSPSTLMMEYGVNIGEGLNLGFEKEMERPTILNQLENIYTPAAAPVASSNSMTFAPVVYIDVQGGDQDIADEIDRQLRRTFDTYARAFMERNARRGVMAILTSMISGESLKLVIEREAPVIDATVTEHPIERGRSISDHMESKSEVMELSGIIVGPFSRAASGAVAFLDRDRPSGTLFGA